MEDPDIDFILDWIQTQIKTTRANIRIVDTVLFVFYFIFFLGSIGFEFPETRSFWLGLPRSLAASSRIDPVIVLGSLNVLVNVYLGLTRRLSFGLHITVGLITVLRGTFSFSLTIFASLYVMGELLKRGFRNSLAIFDESIDRLKRMKEILEAK